MRLLRHWKMILGLAALFGAGCITGAVGLLIMALSHPSPESLNRWVNYRFKDYDRRLKLTPEQREKLRPVVQKTREQIRAVTRSGIEQTVPILETAQHQIEAELTPTQRAEFEKLNRASLKRLRDFERKEAAIPQPQSIPSASAPAAQTSPTAKPQQGREGVGG